MINTIQGCIRYREGAGAERLKAGLDPPISIKIEWVLQLGFFEAHHVSFGPCEE